MALTTVVAILGCYRSGSSLLAGVLHRLGVDMGSPFWGDYYEPADLSDQLRRWWAEPRLKEMVPKSTRIEFIRNWINNRKSGALVGMKHPLLALSAQDVWDACDGNALWIRASRPLEDSIASLEKRGWWPDAARIQTTLHRSIDLFLQDKTHLTIEHSSFLQSPESHIDLFIRHLGHQPTQAQREEAHNFVRQPTSKSSAKVTVAKDLKDASTYTVTSAKNSIGKLVATVLSGNSQDIIADAVRSVQDWVDEIILIDTGITDKTIEFARKTAGEKLVVRSYEWQNDFAAARNESLRVAVERGASWALTLDTDERMIWNGIQDRDELMRRLKSASHVQAWMVPSRDGSYWKERMIRVPTLLRWQGRTHEALVGASDNGRPAFHNACFWEVAKSPEAFRNKLQRDLLILQTETVSNPQNARWWYYLGKTYELLGAKKEALQAFVICATLPGWNEKAAWASYCAAKCFADEKKYEQAEQISEQGLVRDDRFPELAWMIGWCSYQRGDDLRAIEWAHKAINIGSFAGDRRCEKRIGFRSLPAWYENPYDLLRFAHKRQNRLTEYEQADAQYREAKDRRERLILGPRS